MIKAFHIGRTGAAEHQKMMSVTANNMANANTDGFKASNATFQELLHQRMRMPNDYESRPGLYERRNRFNTRNWNNFAPPPVFDEDGEQIFRSYPGNIFTENKLRVGTGSRLSENALVMTQGSLTRTDNVFSAALADPRAFFAVGNPYDPESEDLPVLFTRLGMFTLTGEDDELFLVTTAGEYILDENFERISVSIDVNREDIILVPHTYPADEEDENIIRIGVFTFDNLYGLEHFGGNKFAPTEFSGEYQLIESPPDNIIRQYYVEASNVNIADEMVKIIQAQRAFQSNLTTIRTADEIAAYVNQLRSGQ
jgi:flagellar basal-body rod protein FlgG